MFETLNSVAEFHRISGGDGILRTRGGNDPGAIAIHRESPSGIFQKMKVAILDRLRPSRHDEVNRYFYQSLRAAFGQEHASAAVHAAGISTRRPLTSRKVRNALGFLSNKGLTSSLDKIIIQKKKVTNDPAFRAVAGPLNRVKASVARVGDGGAVDAYVAVPGRTQGQIAMAFTRLGQSFAPFAAKLSDSLSHEQKAVDNLRDAEKAANDFRNARAMVHDTMNDATYVSLEHIRTAKKYPIEKLQTLEAAVKDCKQALQAARNDREVLQSSMQSLGRRIDSIANDLDQKARRSGDSSLHDSADNFRRVKDLFAGDNIFNMPKNITTMMKDGHVVFGARLRLDGKAAKTMMEKSIRNALMPSPKERTDAHGIDKTLGKDMVRGRYRIEDDTGMRPLLPELGETGGNRPSDARLRQLGTERFEQFFGKDRAAAALFSKIMNQTVGNNFLDEMQLANAVPHMVAPKDGGQDARGMLMMLGRQPQALDRDGSGRDYTLCRLPNGGYRADIRLGFSIQATIAPEGVHPTPFMLNSDNSSLVIQTRIEAGPEDIRQGNVHVHDSRVQGDMDF